MDSYFETYFRKVNVLSKKGYEKSAKFYNSFYGDFLPKNRNVKILDLGCGTGQFLYFLEKQGYKNYYGIDISKQQIQFCKNKITERVEVADIFEFLKDKKNNFDIIVANDVFEHLPKNRLIEFSKLIHISLKNNGILLIKVPNMSNPFGLMNRYIDITHEVGFTEHSLSTVLETGGFQKVEIKGAAYPVISLKSAIGKPAKIIVYSLLKILLLIQGYAVPRIIDKDIIAIAKKSQK